MVIAERAQVPFVVGGPVSPTLDGVDVLWFLLVVALVVWGIRRFKRDD